ncbi:MAG: TIGR03088 family PEP-CTERM/XrtA system glycosyltransferase [Hydrogenophaga sp.]|nr:TIGR03088 family PEP-CTERM/XrtA system glycosyltransferase [Hydrogenophaga sp.]MDZ4356019.1 TIGR03088 family PEP-CTERM/XrtA system glycosyltransferase [Variovorax sp.]
MSLPACHIVHLIYRLTTGGLENVVVQLINNLPHGEFRHTVVSITDADPQFVQRIERKDVDVICLNKPPGQPFALYPKTYRLLRRLKPDVVHTCNLAALEFMPMAALAGVPLRVHAEHGMDMGEINTKGSRYLTLRKIYKPFVHEFIAVSAPLHGYLQRKLNVAPAHVHLIPNGVDTHMFRPPLAQDRAPPGFPFQRDRHWVIGTVGRQVHIKNPLMLVDAFVSLAQSGIAGTERMRLAMVGDGPLLSEISERVRSAGLADRAWLPGVRGDVADILRSLDCFVLPSLSEGTSCTLQEAMATGLPIVVTNVGGNAELLEHGACGSLVPSGDVEALKSQLLQQLQGSGREQAAAALNSARQRHGLSVVMRHYRDLFLSRPGSNSAPAAAGHAP